MTRLLLVPILLLTISELLHAQTGDWFLSFGVRGSYTTSSKVFYNPQAPSPDIRSQYLALDNIYGGGVELRLKNPGDNFFLALSVEYLSKLLEQSQVVALTTPPRRLPVTDGFRLIPVELGANVFIPLGSENVRLSMGGGIGAYFGERILTVAGVDAVQKNKPVGYGIHVESSFDYRLLSMVSVRAEMRFRDPEVVAENQFDQATVQYNGAVINFPHSAFKTKINVNGLSFGLGLAVDLF